MNKERGFR
ncbi:Protein of unknown function [Thermobacillus xylanilyticus]|uniref:Uncharacterized protein n=1 Tax=Thermobacillus xylanilyticus TaxID=76633 RepID=A0ABM8V8V4_THEXY|nr:Protein of unknown function [Thermobacillus xylanilyticus]